MKPILRLIPRPLLIGIGLLALAHGAIIILQADLLARAIAHLDPGPLAWLVPVIAARAGIVWAAGAAGRRAAALVKGSLRDRVISAAAPGESGGRLATLAARGLDALDPYVSGYLPQMATAALVPPLVLVWLALADWPSALIIVLTLPLIPIFGILIGVHTREVTKRQWELLSRLGGHFRDVVAGLSTLRAFRRTEHQSGVVREMAAGHRRATMKALRVAFLSALALELVATLSVALVAVPVGLRLLEGGIEFQTALIVLLLTPEAYIPLRALGTRFHASAEGMAVAEEALGLEPAAAPAGGIVPPADAEIRLEDVTVRYPGSDRPALEGVSLTIRPGERIAITGESGAGKTTLLHLIMGFVTPESGRVLVGGIDLAEIDLEAWRARLAWVPQHPHLFAGSVVENVRLGNESGDVDRAIAHAHAGFVADLPDGLGTQLGERGLGLSAGQRQRIALARAYLRDAPIVLLDEPTARLDLHSEGAVVDAARRLLDGRTALLVAHRPAMLSAADRVHHLETAP